MVRGEIEQRPATGLAPLFPLRQRPSAGGEDGAKGDDGTDVPALDEVTGPLYGGRKR